MSRAASRLVEAAQYHAEELQGKLDKIAVLANGDDRVILTNLIESKGVAWIVEQASCILHEVSHSQSGKMSARGLRRNAEILMNAHDDMVNL